MEVIDHQYNDDNKQAKKLPRFFHPWRFRFHGGRYVLGMVLGYPVHQSIIIKDLIKMIGGEIVINSKKGKGTNVSITIPSS